MTYIVGIQRGKNRWTDYINRNNRSICEQMNQQILYLCNNYELFVFPGKPPAETEFIGEGKTDHNNVARW